VQLTARASLQLAEMVDIFGEVSAVAHRRCLQFLMFPPDLMTRRDAISDNEGEGCSHKDESG
jgi:hypothetical protein